MLIEKTIKSFKSKTSIAEELASFVPVNAAAEDSKDNN